MGTIDAVITGRIDRLWPKEKTVLKKFDRLYRFLALFKNTVCILPHKKQFLQTAPSSNG
jgi:hypothetical protein